MDLLILQSEPQNQYNQAKSEDVGKAAFFLEAPGENPFLVLFQFLEAVAFHGPGLPPPSQPAL